MQPTQIKYHRLSKILELQFPSLADAQLSAEYLRVYSPSAEVRGHHPKDAVLQVEKQDVRIVNIIPQGNYAIRLEFDDGHDSGIYTWNYLYDLAANQQQYWASYLQDLQAAGGSRKSNIIASSTTPVWNPDPH